MSDATKVPAGTDYLADAVRESSMRSLTVRSDAAMRGFKTESEKRGDGLYLEILVDLALGVGVIKMEAADAIKSKLNGATISSFKNVDPNIIDDIVEKLYEAADVIDRMEENRSEYSSLLRDIISKMAQQITA